MAISAAGFGRRIDWEDDEAHPGHGMSFKRSVELVSTGVLVRILCPKWFFEWAPTKKIRDARDGFAEFRVRSPQIQSRISTLWLGINSMCSHTWWR